MCEEMGFMDSSLYDIVFPLTGRDKATLIGITTMDDYWNPVNQLFELKDDDGDDLFEVVTFDFVCQPCKDAGLEIECKHRLGELPPWLSAQQFNKMQKMYEATDHSKQFLAEIKGILSDEGTQPIYNKEDIDRFEERPCIKPDEMCAHRNVWIATDPYGGGKMSDYSMVSMVIAGSKRIIVGMESYRNPKPLAEYTVVFNHIQALREIPGLESATFWVIPESNLSGHATLHEVVLQGMMNVRVMHEDTKKDAYGNKMAGFRTTESNKRRMATKMHAAFNQDRVYLYNNFVSVGGQSRQDVRAGMFSQIRMFSRVIIPPLDPIKHAPKERITGKLRAGLKDDIMMTMLIVNAMISKFHADVTTYGEFV